MCICRQSPEAFPEVPAVPGNFSSSGEFVKLKVWESFPVYYRLTSSQEAKSNETALYEAMPGWEIAYLARLVELCTVPSQSMHCPSTFHA